MDEAVKATMNESNRPTRGQQPADPHADHDALLIAAFAADDLDGEERAGAERLVAGCSDCRLLFEDVRAIASATAIMPAVARRRDFRLTPEDAARLRPMGWRRLVAAFAGTRFAVTRPLAIGLTTLGLAGLLISAIPGQGGFMFGIAGAAPALNAADAPGGLATGVEDGTSSLHSVAAVNPQVTDKSAPAPAAAASAGVSVPAATAAPASLVPQPSAAGGGTTGVSGGGQGSAAPSQGTNPVTRNDQSPGPESSRLALGNDGVDTAGGVLPPDANGSGKIVPAAPEAIAPAGPGQGPASLATVSLLLLVAGVGLLVARSAARRVSRR